MSPVCINYVTKSMFFLCHSYLSEQGHITRLICDIGLAHHESAIAQWLEHPTGIWKVMGSTPVGRTQIFSE